MGFGHELPVLPAHNRRRQAGGISGLSVSFISPPIGLHALGNQIYTDRKGPVLETRLPLGPHVMNGYVRAYEFLA
jgi:hypothetical protein